MLIFATLGINALAIIIWSVKNNANGFLEVGKLLRGEASFVPVPKQTSESGFEGFNQLTPSPEGTLVPTREQLERWQEREAGERS